MSPAAILLMGTKWLLRSTMDQAYCALQVGMNERKSIHICQRYHKTLYGCFYNSQCAQTV